ncbi:MAG: zinc-ribbon domain-containing protein [Burkholderiales bacterium]|nr:zinc-ribbon and DUF3426 domain-containing protein [Nitrosomonas sp.]MCP5273704.1 zinc-ribbon domain-containing protein [Burkholderiales bacterium]
MALVTLCPGCGTTYKIYSEQLQAQNGLVRCGKCQVIFNGFATLITIDESEIEYFPAPVEKKLTPKESEKIEEGVGNSHTLFYDSATAPNASLLTEHAQRESAEPDKTVKSAEHVALEKVVTAEKSSAPASDFLSDTIPQRTPQYWAWKYGNIALCILLIAQLIHVYRAGLAILMPQTRPYLEDYCAVLGCTVPLPKNIQLLSIVSSDLQVKNPGYQPDVATLTTVIRNHAPHAQALPVLKLFLTDRHNQVLASRIFTAADYLSEAQKEKRAIQPNQEIIIQLYLDNSQLKSTGYQLQLSY